MRVLVIFEEIPESTRFYLIEDPDKESLDYLKRSHGSFVGYDSEDEEAAVYVSKLLEDSGIVTCFQLRDFLIRKLDYTPCKPFDLKVDLIVHTGLGM